MGNDENLPVELSTDDIVPVEGRNPERAFELHEQVLKLEKKVALTFLEFGKVFDEIKSKRLYEFMECTSFDEYLAQPDIALDRSTVYALIRIHQVYVEKYKTPVSELADINWSKLNMIAPVVKDNNYSELLEKAKVLSRSDLRREVESLKNHPAYTGEIFNEADSVIDELRGRCPIKRGSMCPLIIKYRNDILKEENERKQKEGKK